MHFRLLISFFLTILPVLVPAQQVRLRLMAANTTSGNNQSYQDPGIRIFQGLRPDIVMIQEFNYGSNSAADLRTFVDTAFGPTFQYYREGGNEQIPNGIISRYPIIASGEWIDNNVSNRDFAWARIDIPGPVDLWVVSVHLLTTSSANRNAQAQALVSYINANVPANDYLVIGGDLNTGSRTESAISTLRQVVLTNVIPVDQNGNGNTNAGRNDPYDWVLPDADINALRTSVVIGSNSFPNGLVFDSRVYNPLGDVSPVQRGDSGVSGMQHMAVVMDFFVNAGGATPSPSPSPSPTASASPTPTGPTPTSATPSPSPTSGPSNAQLFINEIHYDDNSSPEENEGVEIAGPAGQSLAGWQVVPYNGANGQTYSITDLSGTIPNQQGCMGTVWVPILGLQNGSPDGVALVNPQGQVMEFLSWEGVLTATNGPAVGATSTDIGVQEANVAPGLSLQRTGTGNKGSDFIWAGPANHTRALPNNNQTFNGCAATPTPTATATASPSPTPSASPTAVPTSVQDAWLVN